MVSFLRKIAPRLFFVLLKSNFQWEKIVSFSFNKRHFFPNREIQFFFFRFVLAKCMQKRTYNTQWNNIQNKTSDGDNKTCKVCVCESALNTGLVFHFIFIFNQFFFAIFFPRRITHDAITLFIVFVYVVCHLQNAILIQNHVYINCVISPISFIKL